MPSRRRLLLSGLANLLAALCVSGLFCQQVPLDETLVQDSLPQGSAVALVADVSSLWGGATDSNQAARFPLASAVFSTDLNGNAVAEIVGFYLTSAQRTAIPGSNSPLIVGKSCDILVLDHEGKALFQFSEPDAHSFDPFSGVWDINSDGRDEIVFFAHVGPAAGGILRIFRWTGEQYENVAPDKLTRFYGVELADQNGDGVKEVILTSHRPGDLPQVLQWTSDRYEIGGGAFPDVYDTEINRNRKYFREMTSVPWEARLAWGQTAVEGLLRQQKYDEALSLTEELLGLIEQESKKDPGDQQAVTKGNVVVMRDTSGALFLQKRSQVHVVRGDILQRSAKEDEAAHEYEEAIELYDRNEQARGKLKALLKQ